MSVIIEQIVVNKPIDVFVEEFLPPRISIRTGTLAMKNKLLDYSPSRTGSRSASFAKVKYGSASDYNITGGTQS
jgi:hypothetical protein